MSLEGTKARTAPKAPKLAALSSGRKNDRMNCRVNGCKIRTSQFYLMHRFPDPDKEPDRYSVWRKTISYKLKKEDWHNTYICSKHFEEKYFIGMDLLPNAVPTLNLSLAENTAYIEKRAADELTNYLQRKSALMKNLMDGTTPIPDCPEKALQRDNILPSGPQCKPQRPNLFKCSVKDCCFTTTQATQLFPFPNYKQNNDRLKHWLSLLALAERIPVKELRICNQHFTPNSYQDSTYTVLKPDALPTLRTGRQKKVRLLSVPPPRHIIEMCCACLATEVRMHRLSKQQVEQYNKLLGLEADKESESVAVTSEALERLPPAVCYECLAMLARFNQFKERARRARNTLKDVSQSKTLDQSVREINRPRLDLESPLSWCSLDGLSIEPVAYEELDLEEPMTLDMDVHVDDSQSDDDNTGGCYECETCGNTFMHKTSLERHIDSHRPDDEWGLEQNVCEQCFEAFPTSQALLAHTSQHLLRTSHKYIEIFDTRPFTKPDNTFNAKTFVTTEFSANKPKKQKTEAKTQKVNLKQKNSTVKTSTAAAKSVLKNKKEPPKMKKIARVNLMRESKVEEILHIDLKGVDKQIVHIDLKEERIPEVKDESFSDVETLDEEVLDDDVL